MANGPANSEELLLLVCKILFWNASLKQCLAVNSSGQKSNYFTYF